MERRQLEYFLAIVDHGGFNAASNALHLAQPSLSHSIKLLERELGAELFHRMPRGVQLTAAGEALIDSARRALRDMEIARSSVHAVAGMASGRLDLVSLPALALDPLARVIGAFRASYPGIQVRLLQPEEGAEVRKAIRTGAGELGLTATSPKPHEDLASHLVGNQELVVTFPPGTTRPPDRKVDMAELLGLELVAGLPGTQVRDMLEAAASKRGIEAPVVVEVGHRESALHMVMAGAGCAVLPRPLARLATLEGCAVASMEPALEREIHLLHRPGPLSPAARTFLEMLVNPQTAALSDSGT